MMEGKDNQHHVPLSCLHAQRAARNENSLKMLGEVCFILAPFGSQSKLVGDNKDNKCC